MYEISKSNCLGKLKVRGQSSTHDGLPKYLEGGKKKASEEHLFFKS